MQQKIGNTEEEGGDGFSTPQQAFKHIAGRKLLSARDTRKRRVGCFTRGHNDDQQSARCCWMMILGQILLSLSLSVSQIKYARAEQTKKGNGWFVRGFRPRLLIDL